MPRTLWTIAISFLGLAWGLWYWSLPPLDPDLGWHLLGGEWVATHDTVPKQDFINAFRVSWHDYHWLGQFFFFKLYAFFGFQGLEVLLGLLVAGLFVSMLLLVPRQRATNFIWNTLVILGSWYLIREIVSLRPQMFALQGLVFTLVILKKQRPHFLELPILFMCSVVLVNIHVYWIFIPLLWSLYRITPRLIKSPQALTARYVWGGFFLLSSAGFFSPYGFFNSTGNYFENYAVLWDYLTMPRVIRESVFEFQSTFAKTGLLQIVFLLWCGALIKIFFWRRVRVNLPDVLTAFLGALLAILAVKYVAVAGIFGVPYLLRHGPVFPALHRWVGRMFGGILVVGGCVLSALSWQGFPPANGRREALDSMVPISACTAIADPRYDPDPGRPFRVLTHFNHGGWCRWALHQARPELVVRVTTDNRTQGIPGEHFQQSYDLYGLRGAWRETLTQWAPQAIVVGKSYALAQILILAQNEWTLIYQDDVFAVFVPKAAF